MRLSFCRSLCVYSTTDDGWAWCVLLGYDGARAVLDGLALSDECYPLAVHWPGWIPTTANATLACFLEGTESQEPGPSPPKPVPQ